MTVVAGTYCADSAATVQEQLPRLGEVMERSLRDAPVTPARRFSDRVCVICPVGGTLRVRCTRVVLRVLFEAGSHRVVKVILHVNQPLYPLQGGRGQTSVGVFI